MRDGVIADYVTYPITREQPCGDKDIEYDVDFALFRDELSLIESGESKPKTASGWNVVRDRGIKLLAKSRHVRLYYMLAICEVQTRGLSGLAELLLAVAEHCEQYWSELHPQADEDSPDDLTDRTMALEEFSKSATFHRLIRDQVLYVARGIGSIKIRDVLVAEGKLALASSSEPPLQRAACEQILRAAPSDAVHSLDAQLCSVIDSLQRIQAAGAAGTPGVHIDLRAINELFATVRKFVSACVPMGDNAAEVSAPGVGESAPVARIDTGAGCFAGTAPNAIMIRDRRDVTIILDQIIQYYRQAEPSSPVPLLLARAQRLVTLNFLDLIKDLAPSGADQLKAVIGVDVSDT